MEILDVYQFQVDEMVSKWGDKPVVYICGITVLNGDLLGLGFSSNHKNNSTWMILQSWVPSSART